MVNFFWKTIAFQTILESMRQWDSFFKQDSIKKMLEKADSLQRGRISTPVIKAIFSTFDCVLNSSICLQDNIKKMLEKAESLHRGRISTPVIKAILSAFDYWVYLGNLINCFNIVYRTTLRRCWKRPKAFTEAEFRPRSSRPFFLPTLKTKSTRPWSSSKVNKVR